MISKATAVEALPEIGRISINGKTSFGIFKIARRGESILCIKSKRPEFLRALIAKNNPTNVGKIFITVSIPSFAPNQETIKHFCFFYKASCYNIKNCKWNSYY